jgi:hypothetical protein
MNQVVSLPLCLFDTISGYLVELVVGEDKIYKENLKSWRNFCNVSKKVHEIKRYFCVYNLNNIYSVTYLTFDDGDISFLPYSNLLEEARPALGRILSLIENPEKQLFLYVDARSISCSWDAESTFFDDFVTSHSHCFQTILGMKLLLYHSLKSYSSFQNLSFFEVHCQGDVPLIENFTLLLSSIKKLGMFISSGGGDFQFVTFPSDDVTNDVMKCEEVYLSNSFMDDVSQLCLVGRNMKKLNLPGNPNISNVSSFATLLSSIEAVGGLSGNLQHLDLSYCTAISDVSMLGTLKTLILRGCIGITDISALGSVSTLDVREITGIETGLPYDNSIRFLWIDKHMICEVSSYHNKRKNRLLYVYGNEERVTGWLQEGYRNITLEWNTEVENLYHMKDLTSLTLIRCSNVSTISHLPTLTSLTLENCDYRLSNLDFSSLPLLKHLFLYSVNGSCLYDDQIVQVQGPLQFVSLHSCYHLQIEVLTNLISLKIEKSDAITLIRKNECYIVEEDCMGSCHIDCLYIDEHSMIMMR